MDFAPFVKQLGEGFSIMVINHHSISEFIRRSLQNYNCFNYLTITY
jgi:hypothetical protein